MKRKAGILLPITALPSKYGVGDFGEEAYEFVDLIKQAGFKVWQILPLNPLGYGNSPYQPYSSMAMDEIYLSLDLLAEAGYLEGETLKKFNTKLNKVEYEAVREFKQEYVEKAVDGFKENKKFHVFLNFAWVKPYAAFMCLKARNEGCWNTWDEAELSLMDEANWDEEFRKQAYRVMVKQYLLYEQWLSVKKYANKKGIEIIGDLPIYMGLDSAEVLTNQKCFLLDDDGRPTFIAGVPPDYFSETGQRWGNPIYDWDYLSKTGYHFWLDRLEYNAQLYDRIRIDHFRAFDTYWKINADCETAIDGVWEYAPGYDFFDTMFEKLPQVSIIAEDLGDLRKEVLDLRGYCGFPGMKVLQFTFDPKEKNNDFEDVENMIIYTGTHDNQTIRGWYSDQKGYTKSLVRNYFKKHHYESSKVSENFIALTLDSIAFLAVIPMQDILNLDDSARFNTPGTLGSPNWEWKLTSFNDFKQKIDMMRKLIKKAKR